MSIVANDIDTRMVTLRISDTRSNHSTHTLKSRLLKDTSKYSCIVQNLYTDSVPPLLAEDTVLLAILAKDVGGAAYPYTNDNFTSTTIAAPYTQQTKLILRRDHHQNVLAVLQYISMFVDQFNDFIATQNIVNLGGDANFNIDRKIDPALPHDQITQLADRNVGFSVDGSGRAEFFCSDEFLSNFFIYLNPDMASFIGLPTYIFGGNDGVDNITGQTHDLFHIPGGQIAPVYSHGIEYASPRGNVTFRSSSPFYLIDQRETLDVELTIPVSRTINSENGQYGEKVRLASFPIDSYIKTFTHISTKNGETMPTIRIKDNFQGGLLDLADGYQESHVKHFMPGTVRAINTRIYCSYRLWSGVRKEMDFVIDGFYDMQLLFMRKVT